jgi:hypothetical protein
MGLAPKANPTMISNHLTRHNAGHFALHHRRVFPWANSETENDHGVSKETIRGQSWRWHRQTRTVLCLQKKYNCENMTLGARPRCASRSCSITAGLLLVSQLQNAAKFYLPGAGNEERVEASGTPRLSLRTSRRNLVGPPLRTIHASRQLATNDLFYFREAKLKFSKFVTPEVISEWVVNRHFSTVLMYGVSRGRPRMRLRSADFALCAR